MRPSAIALHKSTIAAGHGTQPAARAWREQTTDGYVASRHMAVRVPMFVIMVIIMMNVMIIVTMVVMMMDVAERLDALIKVTTHHWLQSTYPIWCPEPE
jgi:hypothetical protein